MWQYNHNQSPDELYHHGVLGMKWGVRRFQNKDGTLTKSGKKRYDERIINAKSDLSKAKIRYNDSYNSYRKSTLNGLFYNEKALNKMLGQAAEVEYRKKQLDDTKVRVKLENQTKKSNRQSNLEQLYLKKGMTGSEAEVAAYKRIRTEKAIVATAGMTLAAAATYIAYKHYDNRIDKILKAGTTLQNISTNSNRGVTDAFYASMNKMDNTKYRGIYGAQLKTMSLGKGVFESKIGVKSDIKIASKNTAIDALKKLVSEDSSYADTLQKRLSEYASTEKKNKLFKNAAQKLKSGKVDSKVYDALNIGLVDHSTTGEYLSKKFYKTLKDKGYDAIKDINDSKYSGYKAKNPLIVFNGGSKVAVEKVRALGDEEIKKNYKKGYNNLLLKEYIKESSVVGLGAGIVTAANRIRTTNKERAIVRQYRKEHPGSKLSYNEIVRNYKKRG